MSRQRWKSWLRWMLTGAAIVTLGLWTASLWYNFHIDVKVDSRTTPLGRAATMVGNPFDKMERIALCGGLLDIHRFDPTVERTPVPGVHVDKKYDFYCRWWFTDYYSNVWGRHSYSVPLWPLVLAMAIPAGFLWRQHTRTVSRKRNGACLACGYDRRMLAPEARCPECGKPAQ